MHELADHIAAPNSPKPSIETLLHAALPARYVEHTHADSVLAITNTSGGMALAEEVFGDLALVVPYRHSGFALAKICAEAWAERATPATIGIVLMHHGAVACGPTAQESYANMLRIVARAEDYLAEHGAAELPSAKPAAMETADARAIAELRRDISRAAGYPLLLTRCEDPVATAFAQSATARGATWQSPATPQHAVFARRLPMLGRDVAAYAAKYAAYLQLMPEGSRQLDAAPRIVFDPTLGMLAAGITPWLMNAAAISYCHTIATMLRADAHDKYVGLPPQNVLEAELEYGGTEHRIAANRTPDVALAGTVSLLASSVREMLDPLKAAITAGCGAAAIAGENAATELAAAITRFGGVDTLICTAEDRQLVTQSIPWLSLSPTQARVVLIGSGDSIEIRDQCRCAGIELISVASGAVPLQLAQDVVKALAIPSTHSFPMFDAT
jgi:rhamnose utilization protein RhaD (predicted bifunctional aldolase and dehydrogenase)